MDFKISFTPNDVSDVTPNQQRFQTNPKMCVPLALFCDLRARERCLTPAPSSYSVLEVKVGKGFVSAPLPILLEDITFVGLVYAPPFTLSLLYTKLIHSSHLSINSGESTSSSSTPSPTSRRSG
jgi:hypothetical protein